MASKIFVNLPVKNLSRSVEFFTTLGFSFNPQFTSETSTCMVISDSIFVMLMEEARFAEAAKKPVSNAAASTEVIIALDAESRTEVDDLVKKAAEAGGAVSDNKMDHGFMYLHGFQDLDGHLWEICWMDMQAFLNNN
ncbi:VOC family protein [Flavitalea sp. BT771]|uniref:VOC family protein n=1 Tax=Flavitalea sp. BT771 TaxID=3063329 RepID=UPI0026E2607B|nr:VOC family protein [Flavitalea sp. BT771]MDO6432881.1 VOC family protein [Flavitalea sp. BT771]MDV6221843.1 VOC family protein [Flavitalea sp. BT771]